MVGRICPLMQAHFLWLLLKRKAFLLRLNKGSNFLQSAFWVWIIKRFSLVRECNVFLQCCITLGPARQFSLQNVKLQTCSDTLGLLINGNPIDEQQSANTVPGLSFPRRFRKQIFERRSCARILKRARTESTTIVTSTILFSSSFWTFRGSRGYFHVKFLVVEKWEFLASIKLIFMQREFPANQINFRVTTGFRLAFWLASVVTLDWQWA